MANYIIRRLLMLVPTLIGITFVSFLILQFVPGDPARFAAGQEADEETIAIVRKELGLDRSIPVQYGIFLKNVVKGNLGRSMVSRSKVIHEIWPHFLNTVRTSHGQHPDRFHFRNIVGHPCGDLSEFLD